VPRLPVTIPDLGESIAAVRVLRWFKSVGDRVARDEDLLEITTDKIDAVLNSPAAGVLVDIAIPPGERVAVGGVVGTIEGE
jgi:2-oxoglutarate dehydrogenase E2 component (dihydrolipoamide succinyltransferase)